MTQRRETRRRSRWTERVVLLCGAIAQLTAASPVRGCPPDPSDRYNHPTNIGFTIGLSILPRVAFTYGLDLRVGHGPVLGWARVEGHGLTYVRPAIGLKVFHPGTGAEIEAGVAFNSAQSGRDVASAWGVHLAAGRWNPATDAQVQGTIPIYGDRRNYDLGVAAFFVAPGNWVDAIGCNG